VIDQTTELGFPQFGQLQKILNRDTGHRIPSKS
jgi:hypothetical protein